MPFLKKLKLRGNENNSDLFDPAEVGAMQRCICLGEECGYFQFLSHAWLISCVTSTVAPIMIYLMALALGFGGEGDMGGAEERSRAVLINFVYFVSASVLMYLCFHGKKVLKRVGNIASNIEAENEGYVFQSDDSGADYDNLPSELGFLWGAVTVFALFSPLCAFLIVLGGPERREEGGYDWTIAVFLSFILWMFVCTWFSIVLRIIFKKVKKQKMKKIKKTKIAEKETAEQGMV